MNTTPSDHTHPRRVPGLPVRAAGHGPIRPVTMGLGGSALGIYADSVGLVERDDELAVLRRALTRACAGEGSGVAVIGDSGTGKSVLIETTCASALDVRILRGSCDPLRTPRPLGPFRDLAPSTGLEALLRGEDRLLSDVCERMYEVLRAEPTVLVVEDLHWVDAASVDVLRFLCRRIGSMPLLMLVSYRDTEIGPRHPARPLLGDVARLEGLRTIELHALSPDGVRQLVDGTGLEPGRIHALTGGNPFFVIEVVKDSGLPLPASVRDAVLARTSDVTPEDFEVLQLVATAPDRLDDRVLPTLGVDLPTLRRLAATGLLGRARGGLLFRHEIARQAVASTVPLGGESGLHARLLRALGTIEPLEPSVLTHHAVAAQDARRAVRYAKLAALEAANAGSHSEAAAFYRTALDHLDGASPGERADLLHRLGFEQYMTSRLQEAIATVSATFPLWQQVGESGGLSAAHEAVAVFQYYSARRREAEAHADRAARIVSEDGPELAFGLASATQGYLAYMRNDFDTAQQHYGEASRIAEREQHSELALRSRFVLSAAALARGDGEARALLADDVEGARAQGLDDLASTIYSNLAYLDVEHRRFRAAEHVLDQSLPFTVERDIPICRHWQTGVRSRLHFAQGHWSAALEDADQVLEEEGMPLATLWPLLVTALVPMRRGAEVPAAAFDAAWELAERIDEPVRGLAVMSALAERMWMTGTPDSRVTDISVEELDRLATVGGVEWAAGDLAIWLARLDLGGDCRATVAEPFRLSMDGRHHEAAAWWHRTGDPFAEAMAWCDSPDVEHRARGIELLDKLGATGTADRQRVALRRAGVTAVPPRPRVSTRANPAGLTNRQLEVAKLVARGFTNAEIAARLYISPKTADHHVSAVLGKLGLPNRRAVVVQAEELSLG
ncbi:helix-turn-helix transcriptional regulator [Nakamurella sp. GG22]